MRTVPPGNEEHSCGPARASAPSITVPRAEDRAGKTGEIMVDRELLMNSLPPLVDIEVEDLPLRVVPDWDDQVKRATELCRLIDRHLDYEARGRLLLDLDDFRPQHLCPEQRVQMTSDAYVLAH